MKLPLWAKTKDGKWEVFPAYLLETLSDNTQGFRFAFTEYGMEEGKSVAFKKFRDYFEPNPVGWARHTLLLYYEYSLKDQGKD